MAANFQQQNQPLKNGNNLFDPFAWEFCYFFGPMDRKEAESMLANSEIGTFLLRESTTKPGYSLTVKEAEDQVHNYLIERTPQDDGKMRYTISNLSFPDIPALLNHFKLCKLEKTTLIRPLERPRIEKVIGRYKFEGERVSDLPFERGETLDVIGKPEEEWWMARNCLGNFGLIPANYVKVYEEGDEISLQNSSTKSSGSSTAGKRFSSNSTVTVGNDVHNEGEEGEKEIKQKSVPKLQQNSWVRVTASRWPSIYDVSALNIRVKYTFVNVGTAPINKMVKYDIEINKEGQFLWMYEILDNGMCRGQNEEGKIGLFPISYVEPVHAEAVPWHLANAEN